MGQDEVVARLERILANVTRTEPGTATPPVTNSFTPHSDHVSRHMKSVTNRGGVRDGGESRELGNHAS